MNHEASPSRRNRRSNRIQIVILAIVFAAPMTLAWLWRPSSSVNNGELIEPVIPITGVSLATPADSAWGDDELRGLWRFVILAGERCDASCRDWLYVIRQVRLAQGKNAHRIGNVVVVESSTARDLASELAAEYPDVTVLTGDPVALQSFEALFPKPENVAASGSSDLYLIDPAGNLMMRYSSGFDPSLVRKDLSRLLKASRIG